MENRINNLVKMKPQYATQLQRAARLLGVEIATDETESFAPPTAITSTETESFAPPAAITENNISFDEAKKTYDIDKAKAIFSTDRGFDTRKALNRSERIIPDHVIDEIEKSGVSSDMLDTLGVPVFKYKTQITLHGKFNPGMKTRLGGYKMMVVNQNGSLGVRYQAIDVKNKRALKYGVHLANSRSDKSIKWEPNTDYNAKNLELDLSIRVKNAEEYQTQLAYLKSVLADMPNNYIGTANIYAYKSFGAVEVVLKVVIFAIHDRDMDSLMKYFTNGVFRNRGEYEEARQKIIDAEKNKTDKKNEINNKIKAKNEERRAKDSPIIEEIVERFSEMVTFENITKFPVSDDFIVMRLFNRKISTERLFTVPKSNSSDRADFFDRNEPGVQLFRFTNVGRLKRGPGGVSSPWRVNIVNNFPIVPAEIKGDKKAIYKGDYVRDITEEVKKFAQNIDKGEDVLSKKFSDIFDQNSKLFYLVKDFKANSSYTASTTSAPAAEAKSSGNVKLNKYGNRDTIELWFDEKPSDSTLSSIKAKGFRWYKGYWGAFYTEAIYNWAMENFGNTGIADVIINDMNYGLNDFLRDELAGLADGEPQIGKILGMNPKISYGEIANTMIKALLIAEKKGLHSQIDRAFRLIGSSLSSKGYLQYMRTKGYNSLIKHSNGLQSYYQEIKNAKMGQIPELRKFFQVQLWAVDGFGQQITCSRHRTNEEDKTFMLKAVSQAIAEFERFIVPDIYCYYTLYEYIHATANKELDRGKDEARAVRTKQTEQAKEASVAKSMPLSKALQQMEILKNNEVKPNWLDGEVIEISVDGNTRRYEIEYGYFPRRGEKCHYVQISLSLYDKEYTYETDSKEKAFTQLEKAIIRLYKKLGKDTEGLGDELAGLGKLDTTKQRIEKLARSGKFAPQLARAAKLLKIKPTAKKAKAKPPIDKPCTTCEVKPIAPIEPQKPIYTPREYSGKDVIYGKRCKIITPNGNLDGQYAVAEVDFLIPSNNPFTFAPNPNYPAECQTRSYNEDQAERDKVTKYTDDFNYSHLINNSPDATTGTPICNLDGAVLGGNGRTMVMYRIIEQNKRAYADYVRELHDMAGFFGLPEDIVDSFDTPVLLRIVDVQLRECSTVSNMLNKSNSNEYDAIREGIAFARQIEENKQAMDIIVGQLENSEADTFSEMMNDKTIAKSIINLLRNMKIINTTNQGSLIESDNQFTAKGKDFMEAVLLAMILPDKKLINGASSYTLKLVKALPSLLRMKNFPAEWNLIPVIRKITEFEIKRRAIGTPFKDYINQQSAFEAMPSEIEAETWKLLEVLGQNQFKSFVAYYSDRYLAMKDDMFGEKITPIEVIKLYQQKYASELKSKGLSDELAGLFWSLTDDSEQVEVIEKTENAHLNDEIDNKIAENTTSEANNDTQSDEPVEPKPTVTLSDMQKYDVKTIQFHDKILQTLLERIRIPFQILLWGKAGGGKSTFAVRMCNELSQHGKVLYHTSEEELQTGRFIDRMKLMGAETDKIKFSEGRFPELLTALNSEKFDFAVVDSMNRIGVATEELNEMMKEFKSAQGTSFIIIAHADKTGKIYKGDSGVAHDVDTEINITEGIAQAIKHRDGETGKQVSIFPSKQFKYRNPTTIALPMNAR